MTPFFGKRSAICLAALLAVAESSSAFLADEAPESKADHWGFAQCSEYLNIRSEASKDSEIVGKLCYFLVVRSCYYYSDFL